MPKRAGAWLKRTLATSDPETGLFMRLVSTSALIGNLVLARPSGPAALAWTILAASFVAWLVFAVCDPRLPRVSAAALLLSSLLPALLIGPTNDGAAVVAAYVPFAVIASHLPIRIWVVVLVGVAEAAITVTGMVIHHRPGWQIALILVVLIMMTFFGLARRQYRIHANQTRELLEQTRLAQREQARAAALDERARIAREMHDVLAHSLGALSVQLDVAEGLLSEKRDLDGALARVRRSRRLAVDGLAEARAAVAALRTDVRPLPDGLADLAAAYRRDHDVEVDFAVTGTVRRLSPAAEVSLLRTGREALTNAARHAPGSAVTMALAYGDEDVRLEVRNEVTGSTGPSGGHGLTGMRERIALVGGSLSTGSDGPWWQVVAQVPDR